MKIFLILFLWSTSLFCEDTAQEKISLALALHDVYQAKRLLEDVQKKNPNDPKTQELLFDYFIELKDFENIQSLYNKLPPEQKETLSSPLCEKIAWVVIKQAAESSHPRIRAEAALAAAGTHDSQGAHILEYLLTDPHQEVQRLAFELASVYKDACIQERAEELAKKHSQEVKLQAARLLARQKAPCAEKILLELMQDESFSESNLLQLVQALSSLKKADIAWIKEAVVSRSPAVRALAAALMQEKPLPEGLSLLIPLLKDPSFPVKEMAATCLGLYQSLLPDTSALLPAFSSLLHDSSPYLHPTAAWALYLSKEKNLREEAARWFEKEILSSSKERACIATSRLIRTGKEGIPLAQKLLTKAYDPYVQLNLSIYLLLHKASTEKAISTIRSACSAKTLFGHQQLGFFPLIGSAPAHDPSVPRLPEAQDLYFRLSMLALLHYSRETISPKDLEAILHERTIGVSAATAQFLFQEMLPLDEVLTPLLSHEEEHVRIQAALLLAIFSRSQKAALTLLEEYQKASKAGKELVLLGFSLLPVNKTKSLLFPLLFDQSQALRTRAAGVFLSSLYQ